MKNVGKVTISFTVTNKMKIFTVTFISVYGELPLMLCSDNSIIISRQEEKRGVTEIQKITTSVDEAFVYEEQSISVLRSFKSFTLSYGRGESTKSIPCDFVNHTEAVQLVKVLKIELESVASALNLNIGHVIFGNGKDKNAWTYSVIFRDPLELHLLLHSDKVIL